MKINITGKYLHIGKSNSSGVNNKILDQFNLLSKDFIVDKIEVKSKRRNVFQKILSLLPFVESGYDYHIHLSKILKDDFLYIRKPNYDLGLYRFLKEIKNLNKKLLILIEIPTYPYFFDTYFHNLFHFFRNFHLYLKDYFYKKRISQFVNNFIVYSNHNEVLQIPTIKINNGCNVSNYSVRKIKSDFYNGTIRLLFVGHISKSSGLERIIRGLNHYNNNFSSYKIIVNVIGNGKEIFYYKKLVKKYNLMGNFIFHGYLEKDRFDYFYDISDMAIASLGLYKNKVEIGNFLKISEYLAKGMPILTGSKIGFFQNYSFPFDLNFPSDNSFIDFNRIIDFLNFIYSNNSPEEISTLINKYAIEFVDISKSFLPILNRIKQRNT